MNWRIYKSCRASLNSLKRSLLPLHPLYNVTLYTFLSPSILNLIWAVLISANRSLSILFSSIIHSHLVFFLAPRLSAESHYIFRALISPLILMRLSNRYNFNRVRFIHSVQFKVLHFTYVSFSTLKYYFRNTKFLLYIFRLNLN